VKKWLKMVEMVETGKNGRKLSKVIKTDQKWSKAVKKL